MILALDVGTSSARTGLYDDGGRRAGDRFHQVEYAPAVTADGGVEHDPARLLEAVTACLDAVVGGSRTPAVSAVGVATFWHGLLGFDAAGRPATPVYMWADTRSAREAALLREALDEEALRARTGCHVHTSYWPARLRWLRRAQPAVVRRVARWGSLGECLELALFGEAATSICMASGTGLLDQTALRWDPTALAAAEIEPERLFPLCDRTEPRYGLRPPWARRWPALRGVPWFPAVGDGAASNVGSGCTTPARLALNVGTSAALRVVGADVGPPPRGLWRYRLDRRLSVVGGALSEGGNLFAWCRDVLRLPDAEATEAALARTMPDGHGLTVLPFIAGERAPGWRGDRRAVIAGLRLDTTALDIAQAALEAVALRIGLVYGLLAPLVPPEHVVAASGGAIARSPALARMVADVIGRPLMLVREDEVTARGAAQLARAAVTGRADLDAFPAPPADGVAPTAAHTARYRAALQRQRALEQTVS